MTETPTPPPIVVAQGHGVHWVIEHGSADTDDDIINLSDSLPFDPDSDEDTNEYFNTKFKWESVELKYSSIGDDYEPLGRFKLRGRVFRWQDTKDSEGEQSRRIEYIDYILNELTITSEDPNSGGTWVYPTDYPEQDEDTNHPKQYGGVIMKDDTTRRNMFQTFAVCGLEGGPKGDGIVPWRTVDNRPKQAISAYNYIDVFDETEFSFIPMNSNDAVSLKDNEKFRFTPLFPDVKDENGKAAPIYPMNTVTAFRPDGRESVTVTYTARFTASFVNGGGQIELDNPVATIKQTCVQDVSDYAKQLEGLFEYCNWSNPQNLTQEELAPGYPTLYPYTLVNGFEGLGQGKTPKRRGDDKGNEPLQRGDVWYNPRDDERKYYNIADIPEELEVVTGGSGYRDGKAVLCVWMPPDDRCYNLKNVENIPFGLMCDVETKDGAVVSATISNTGSPSGWSDGDIVAVTGGKNNARLRISIKEEPGWVDNYVEVY